MPQPPGYCRFQGERLVEMFVKSAVAVKIMFLDITLNFLNDPCVSVTGAAGSMYLPDESRRSLQRDQEAVLRRVPRPVPGHQRRNDLEEAEASQRHPEGGAADQLQARRRAVGRRNPIGQCD